MKKAYKYHKDFIGVIERNYWGTYFEIFDYGLEEKHLNKLPPFLGIKRKKIVISLIIWRKYEIG